jgi:hypothetical protein
VVVTPCPDGAAGMLSGTSTEVDDGTDELGSGTELDDTSVVDGRDVTEVVELAEAPASSSAGRVNTTAATTPATTNAPATSMGHADIRERP